MPHNVFEYVSLEILQRQEDHLWQITVLISEIGAPDQVIKYKAYL